MGIIALSQACKEDQLPTQPARKDELSSAARLEFETKWKPYTVDETITDGVEVRDGILHFKDATTFQKELDQVGKTPPEERQKFSKEENFVSLLTLYHNFLEEYAAANNAKDKQAVARVAQKYTGVTVMGDDSSYQCVNRYLPMAALTTKEGLVYIGKMLYYFGDAEQRIVLDGDRRKLYQQSDLVKVFKNNLTARNGRKMTTSCYGFQRVNEDRSSLPHKRWTATAFPIYQVYPDGVGTYTMIWRGYQIGKMTHHWPGFGWTTIIRNQDMLSDWSFWPTNLTTMEQKSASDVYNYSNNWHYIDFHGKEISFTGLSLEQTLASNWGLGFNTPQWTAEGGYYFADYEGLVEALCP